MKLATIIAALITITTAWWPVDNMNTPKSYFADVKHMAQRVNWLSPMWRAHLQDLEQSHAVAGNMTVSAEVVENPKCLQATTALWFDEGNAVNAYRQGLWALTLGERMVDKQDYAIPTAATGIWWDAWVDEAACRIDAAEVQIGAGLSRGAIECKDIIGEEDPEHMMWSDFVQYPRYVEL
ncbi:hypothetical protein LTR27_006694 [Elasticomyces elasticus]|nr:hypothetical protein LTR27_006694 [Elasticomyces elasticus]